MKTITRKGMVMLVALITLVSCKKEQTPDTESVKSAPVQKIRLTAENTTTAGITIKSGVKMTFNLGMKSPAGIASLKVILFALPSTQGEVLLDTALNTDSSAQSLKYSLKLKKYTASKLRLVFQAVDNKGDTAADTLETVYLNRLALEDYISVERHGFGYDIRGYDLVNNKVLMDLVGGSDYNLIYRENSSGNTYPILGAGTNNGTTFSTVSFGTVPDSAVTVDMVNNKISSLTFKDKITISSQNMLILAKLPANPRNKPWALLRVWENSTFKQNGSSWIRGYISIKLYDYPVNY